MATSEVPAARRRTDAWVRFVLRLIGRLVGGANGFLKRQGSY